MDFFNRRSDLRFLAMICIKVTDVPPNKENGCIWALNAHGVAAT